MFFKISALYRFWFVLIMMCGICRMTVAGSDTTTLEDKLFDAIGQHDMAAVQTLVNQGANVNAVEHRVVEKGMTPLMEAAYSGQADLAQIFIDRGAKTNVQSKAKYSIGMTPLMWASMGSALDNKGAVIALLLHHGANPEAREEHGRSALMFAGAEGTSNNINALVRGGANVNGADAAGESALLYTAYNGRFDNFAALIHCGANVNAKDNDGRTPLMAAILAPYVAHTGKDFTTQQAEAVKLLLRSGANVRARDDRHMTTIDYALQVKSQSVLTVLQAAVGQKLL